METISHYHDLFLTYLEKNRANGGPKNLYTPINYLLEMGGKRLRPVITLMGTDCFGGEKKEALPAAMAIEMFHNFSLMHDDIMDAAPLRRGQPTVHQKWDVNTGILSGDAMLILSYQFLNQYKDPLFGSLTQLLSKTALEVCEGQQLDIDFETQDNVSLDDYLQMIAFKTAVLVGCALKMGALIAGASSTQSDLAYQYGLQLGIAFQIQDDFLDAFGDPETFGKQVGGDIIENKKTILYHKALAGGTPEQVSSLTSWFSKTPEDATEKIVEVTALFEATKAKQVTQALVKDYTKKAFKALDHIEIPNEKKELLRSFGLWLMHRTL